MILYNLFPLLAGRLSRWNEHFSRAAGMGFDWIFVNPIQQVGLSGSLYSIRDYFQINPFFLDPDDPATPDGQVRQAIDQAHAAGLKVMIDLVINHCAIDAPIVGERPEWFARAEDGAAAHPFCYRDGAKVVWGDLTHIDHRGTRDPEGLYRYCLRVAEHLASLGFDGFRCDAAYQIPDAFWRRFIAEIRSRHPRLCMVAETLGCTPWQTKETAHAGFDFVFNSSKYWDFHDGWLIEQNDLLRDTVATISFPESHDTPRLCEELHGNVDGLKQRYLFAALLSAGVMIPIGFEYGFRKRLHVVETRPEAWETTAIDLGPYIARVNALKKRYSVFREEGLLRILPCDNPKVLLMTKETSDGGQRALLILNKDVAGPQAYSTHDVRRGVPSDLALEDVSPEPSPGVAADPLHHVLGPGQGRVLVGAKR